MINTRYHGHTQKRRLYKRRSYKRRSEKKAPVKKATVKKAPSTGKAPSKNIIFQIGLTFDFQYSNTFLKKSQKAPRGALVAVAFPILSTKRSSVVFISSLQLNSKCLMLQLGIQLQQWATQTPPCKHGTQYWWTFYPKLMIKSCINLCIDLLQLVRYNLYNYNHQYHCAPGYTVFPLLGFVVQTRVHNLPWVLDSS